MKPRLTWMKHLPDAGCREYVAIEAQAMRAVELAQKELDAIRKHAADTATKYCTKLEIRRAKMGHGSR